MHKVEPSNNFLPKWFKRMKPIIPRTKASSSAVLNEDVLSVKKCIPFLESMSAGYTIPMWADLKIERLPRLAFRSQSGQVLNQKPFFLRKNERPEDFVGKYIFGQVVDTVEVGDVGLNINFPENSGSEIQTHLRSQVELEGRFSLVDEIFKLVSPWAITTPKGYSCIFKNPSNNFSSPITLFEAVVDTDRYYNPVAFPFFVSDLNSDEYIIKAGTPICQVIPVKRERFDLEVGLPVDQRVPINTFAHFMDYYRRYNWHKGRDISD